MMSAAERCSPDPFIKFNSHIYSFFAKYLPGLKRNPLAKNVLPFVRSWWPTRVTLEAFPTGCPAVFSLHFVMVFSKHKQRAEIQVLGSLCVFPRLTKIYCLMWTSFRTSYLAQKPSRPKVKSHLLVKSRLLDFILQFYPSNNWIKLGKEKWSLHQNIILPQFSPLAAWGAGPWKT